MKKVFLPVGMLLVLMVFSTLVQGQSRKLRKVLEEHILAIGREMLYAVAHAKQKLILAREEQK